MKTINNYFEGTKKSFNKPHVVKLDYGTNEDEAYDLILINETDLESVVGIIKAVESYHDAYYDDEDYEKEKNEDDFEANGELLEFLKDESIGIWEKVYKALDESKLLYQTLNDYEITTVEI